MTSSIRKRPCHNCVTRRVMMGSIGKRSERYQAQVRCHGAQVISRTHSQKERMHDELQVALTHSFNHMES